MKNNDNPQTVSKRIYNFVNSKEVKIKTPQKKISADNLVKIIENKYSMCINNHFQPVTTIVVSKLKNIIASISSDKIMIWDLQTLSNTHVIESKLKSFLVKTPSPRKLLISESLDYIIYTDVDDFIKLYNLKDKQEPLSTYGVGETINAIHFTNKEKKIIAITATSINFYTFPNISLFKSMKLSSINKSISEKIPLLAQVFDSQILIVPRCTSSQLFIISKKNFHQISLNSKIYPTVIQLSFSKNIFILGCISGGVFYLDQLSSIDSVSEFSALSGHHKQVNFVAFAPNDLKFVTAGLDEFALVWDTFSKTALKKIVLNGTGCISGCFYDEFNLIVGYSGFYMEKLNIECEGQGFWMPGHADTVSCIALSYSCNFIVTGGNDCGIFVWNLIDQSWNCLHKAHECPLVCISISKDDRLIASSGFDLSVKVWKRDDFQILHHFNDNHLKAIKVEFSSHSDHLVSKSLDHSFKIYDLAQDKRILCLYLKQLKYKFRGFSKSKKYLILSSEKYVYEVFRSTEC